MKTIQFVRTVCKTVHDQGCKRYGEPAQFRRFLRVQLGMESVPHANNKSASS